MMRIGSVDDGFDHEQKIADQSGVTAPKRGVTQKDPFGRSVLSI
jgi:hypothetical protein